MKNLIYIDNHSERQSQEDIEYATEALEDMGLPEEYIKTMKFVFDFHRLERNDAAKILFNPKNIICTHSAFTASHLGSFYQLRRFLNDAGKFGIRGITYIDTSLYLKEGIQRALTEDEKLNTLGILVTLTNNNIVCFENAKAVRILPKLEGIYNDDLLKTESINLNDFIQ